ncbi:MAG: aldo/keto reductase [Candidatus Aminicenantes bacterium]|nr:aldo/keto reductase [Candidatus Aminicenantes bacterium]
MEYKYFGRTGVKISPLCFGTMSFGGDADKATSAEMYRLCRDSGINIFDCANVYQAGTAEEYLGEFIRDERQDIFITSKVYFPTGKGVNDGGSTRKHIRHALEDSLRRLGTDYIDIYFLHRFDDNAPLEETLSVLNDLVHQGKILYAGVSNFSAWQTQKSVDLAAQHGYSGIQCVQPMYNLVKRQAEIEIFPQAQNEGLAVFPYSPLGGGLLTGKYSSSNSPDQGRLLTNARYKTRYGVSWMEETAARYKEFAESEGLNPVSLAIAWVASHPAVTAPIIGARNTNQLRDCLKALEIDMGGGLRERMSALSPEPPPSTDRNEEKTPHNYGVRK